MTIPQLEAALGMAQQRFDAAIKALAPKHKGSEREEYQVANTAVLALERTLAEAKGEQYADVSDFPVQWDTGAPMPHVLANEHRTFLIFHVREIIAGLDGTTVAARNLADDRAQTLALVEFERCVSFRMGVPNDEVVHGHPLSGKGLEDYTAQIVRHSEWIKELENINKVHAGYRPEHWKNLTHHVLWFHDSTFEYVAKSYKVEVVQQRVADLMANVCARLLG